MYLFIVKTNKKRNDNEHTTMACWKRKVLKSEHSEEIARIGAKKFCGKNAPRFSFSLTEDGLSIYGAIFLRISGLVWFSSFSFLFYSIFFRIFVVHQRNLRRIARKRTVQKRWKRYIIVGIADAICLPYYLVFLVHATKTVVYFDRHELWFWRSIRGTLCRPTNRNAIRMR